MAKPGLIKFHNEKLEELLQLFPEMSIASESGRVEGGSASPASSKSKDAEDLGTCVLCDKEATNKCGSCFKVAYCGKEHQVQDWATHKTSCPAFKVLRNDDGTLSFVATRTMGSNVDVFVDFPFVLGPDFSGLRNSTACPGCLYDIYPDVDESSCPRCEWPMCSADCLGIKDPVFHAAECELLEALKSRMFEQPLEVIFPLRCLLLQRTNPKMWEVFKRMASCSKIRDSPDRPKMESRVFLEDSILKPLSEVAPHLLPPDYSPATLDLIFEVILAYGLSFPPHGGPIGAISAFAGALEHSCQPNTRSIFTVCEGKATMQDFQKSAIIVRTSKRIKKGEPLTTTVVDLLFHTDARQSTIVMKRGKMCFCDRCVDPRECGTDKGTLKCQRCGGWLVAMDPRGITSKAWQCIGECGARVPGAKIKKRRQHLTDSLKQMESKKGTMKQALKLREEYLKYLHPKHYMCVSLQIRMIRIYEIDYTADYDYDGADEMKANEDALNRRFALCWDVLHVLMDDHFIPSTDLHLYTCLLSMASIMWEREHFLKLEPDMAKRTVETGDALSDLAYTVRCGDYEIPKLACVISKYFSESGVLLT